MKLIEIDSHDQIELWAGRRLLLTNGPESQLIALPKGALSTMALRGSSTQVAFGVVGRTTMIVTGKTTTIELMVAAIVEMERPDRAFVRKIK